MTHKHGHTYELRKCLGCAAALVISARPSRAKQEAMLVHASQYWPRKQIIKEIANAG